MKRFLIALALVSLNVAQAAPLAFVACPIVRDTSTVPCWLAEYKGELYFLGIQEDQAAAFDPPSLGHQALVEGAATNEPRICGGIPLKPVHVSVLEADGACNTMLPSDVRYQLPFAPPRGPGPRGKRQRAEGASIGAGPVAAAAPTAPFQPREFTVRYDFDNERAGLSTRDMIAAMTYANAIKASRVEITAYRASVRLSDGKTLVEQPFIAQRRATTLAQTLGDIGVRNESIVVKWIDKPTRAKGAGDAENRRAIILVSP
jgi:hypothetical protein